ncbi:class I SAM-dependent methyltransferase [Candidatus Bathyarchaeota archaeon]|nr:class I SAM-dependent methyltransferase [Candidatus Bathyarchaeota archaeon]
MKPEEDAFGQMIWAYYQGKEVFEIWERNDGYISIDLPKTYLSEYEEWALHQRTAMEFVKGKVLDIGCGAGRHSLYLQKKGFDVLGIDVSPLAVKICRLRGLKKARVMSIEEVNFKPSSFDSIIMMGNNFSLFGSFKKARRLLKRFHRMTSSNALIVTETRDPYKTNNPTYLEYYEFNKKRGRMSGRLRGRIRFEKYIGKWFDWLMVSKKEMKKILKGTGWKIKEFIDSNDSQYIAIIEKVV